MKQREWGGSQKLWEIGSSIIWSGQAIDCANSSERLRTHEDPGPTKSTTSTPYKRNATDFGDPEKAERNDRAMPAQVSANPKHAN